MRTCLLVECLLVGLAGVLAVVTPLPGAEEKAAHFKLYYGHAGLTEISVEASKLPNEGSRLR